MTKAYSYARFSSDEQKFGDSERRQVEAAEAWCQRKGLTIEPLTPDRGLSGFTGKHRRKGSLGKFLKEVESGRVPKGSVLLVENIDRLGREGPSKTLRQIIFKLWDFGITLQTFAPEESYPPDSENDPKFVVLILYLQRAHDESKRKSDLSNANWQRKQSLARSNGTIVTAQAPAWLRVTEWRDNGKGRKIAAKLEPIPEAVEAIKLLFRWRFNGMEWRGIVRRLNAEAAWRPKSGWSIWYVKKLAASRILIGEYQPCVKRQPTGEPVPKFYPRVISDGDFQRMQTLLDKSKTRAAFGGRISKARSLFTHLAVCGYCGGPMCYIDKGSKRGGQWLVCDAGRRGKGCQRRSIRYEEIEEMILRNCRAIKPEDVLPKPDEQADRAAELKERIAGKEAEIEGIDGQIDNYITRLGQSSDADILKRIEAKVAALRDHKAAAEAERAADRVELEKAEHDHKSFAEWQSGLKTLVAKLKSGDVDLRLKMRAHLRRFLARIVVFADGKQSPPRIPKGASKEQASFIEDLRQRRATKEGRFVNLIYVTGDHELGLAPPGSVAFTKGSLYPTIGLAGPKRLEFVGHEEELFNDWKARQLQRFTIRPAKHHQAFI
jgi:DNA invertase Pin-like site-specific DNA recombinase